jgi:hypothetical protein
MGEPQDVADSGAVEQVLNLTTDGADVGEKPTAALVKDALLRRYCGGDLTGTQWVCLDEARSGAGFDGNAGSCDFLAINTFKGRGMELIGHEVKVSMADWKKEMAAPDKAERFARYCRRWYVAVPAALASKIKDEVPPAWGLLSLSDKGRWTETVKAPARTPHAVPEWWWIGWLAQIDRQAKKRIPYMVNEAMRAEREAMTRSIEQAVESRRRHADEQVQSLRENAQRLKEATGIDLVRAWSGNFDRLPAAWALVHERFDIEHLTKELRSTADVLDTLTIREDVAS